MAPVNPSRKARAAETRRRMIEAARACFVQDGYAGTPMTAIAERADVAVQTLYFTFHTKAELLGEVFEAAVFGDEDPAPPNLQPWYRATAEAPDPATAMRTFAEGVAGIVARVAPLRPVFDGAAAEPNVAELWANGERLREEGYGNLFATLVERHPLRTDVTFDHVIDVALVLLGPVGHRGFVEDRGWPVERWTTFAADQLRAFFASD